MKMSRSMIVPGLPVLALVLCGLRAGATTVPECQVKVLQVVKDDLGNIWQPEQVLPVTIERDDANGGTFCASGGSCLPRSVDGKDALQLLNCSIGPAITDTDRRLIPSAALARKKTAAAMMMRQNAEQKLSALGFSNAAGGSLAEEYVDHPRSRNGRLVARALAGSTAALALLKQSNP